MTGRSWLQIGIIRHLLGAQSSTFGIGGWHCIQTHSSVLVQACAKGSLHFLPLSRFRERPATALEEYCRTDGSSFLGKGRWASDSANRLRSIVSRVDDQHGRGRYQWVTAGQFDGSLRHPIKRISSGCSQCWRHIPPPPSQLWQFACISMMREHGHRNSNIKQEWTS